MTRHWLLVLGEMQGKPRERELLRLRLQAALRDPEPRTIVGEVLEVLPKGNMTLRALVEAELVAALAENEALWWALDAVLPRCRKATLALVKRVLLQFCATLGPDRLSELLGAALVCQLNAPRTGYSLQPEGLAVRLSLLLDAIRACAQTRPGVSLRTLKRPLEQSRALLSFGSEELVPAIDEVLALIESTTRSLKNLPLPSASSSLTTRLPRPAHKEDDHGG